ncbi:hypothetical protein BDZ90DRAFT_273640 [Jaminaea rosea]|uniref:Uncharacterized protein n=1 Tax=Jaminaea rosea TaxID=1569628 RepID=A0A316V0S7_9BASI|nr:hypothetical protein BDZ90DRAFT_273640 [Jaminaea rosea]PWN29773.1 hypothetical protein BDZ90DRAFT_273640 [Jaminaea rosea]
MCALLHLLPLFVLLLALPYPSLSEHRICEWQDQGTPPEEFGYRLWCISIIHKHRPYKATWECKGKTVADLGYLREGVLEIYTACGTGGYADDCDWDTWGACIDPEHCYFTSKSDDCEWPDKFTSKYAPRTIAIWQKLSSHNLTQTRALEGRRSEEGGGGRGMKGSDGGSRR